MSKGPGRSWIELFAGVERRRLVATEQIYQMEVRLAPGSHVPLHHHPQDQVAYLVRGRMRFQVGDGTFEVEAGGSVAIPGNTPHAVWALEECMVVDTFAPPRADYLAADAAADGD